ncbi:unnamed protein product, partial [Ectocarpus sp. 12 AP-2014]
MTCNFVFHPLPVFLAHLGIATVDFEFQQDEAAEYGVYHSIYDSFSWVDNYGDPGFRYFQAASRVWGLLALRLATSDVLPFDPPLQAAALQDYVSTLSPSASSSSSSSDSSDEDAGNFGGSLVLSETDLAPLQDAVEAFRAAADKVGSWSQEAFSSSGAAGGVMTEPGGGGPSTT